MDQTTHRRRPKAPPTQEEIDTFLRAVDAHLAGRPRFLDSVLADAKAFASYGLERWPQSTLRQWLTAARLCWTSDDYFGVVLYRLRTALQRMHLPLVPRIIHRICIVFFGIRIGNPVVVKSGIYMPHGNVVMDGVVEIGHGCVICPWVTVGLKEGLLVGPKLGNGVFVGTGAKILGPIKIGDNAKIAAGAVVVTDVAPYATVTGVPARPVLPHEPVDGAT